MSCDLSNDPFVRKLREAAGLKAAIEKARGGPTSGSSYPDPLGLRAREIEPEPKLEPKPDRLIIIGITGLARSGKDTIAGILCQRFGFTRVALADGVRSAFRDLDGPTWELTKDLEAIGKTSRWALQRLGTEARWDARCPAVWLDLAATKMAYLSEIHPERRHRFVIPDIRFQIEADHFGDRLGRFFRLWKSIRPSAGLPGELANHASEREVDLITPDLAIPNGGSIADLETIVSQYARQLLEAP